MFIRATKHFRDDAGQVRPGQILDMTDYRGADLVRRGLAIDVQGDAKRGARSPTESPAINSRIGEAKQSSSSPAAPAPQTPNLFAPEAEQSSSALTKDTGSHPGQTHSTPATETGGRRRRESRSSRG